MVHLTVFAKDAQKKNNQMLIHQILLLLVEIAQLEIIALQTSLQVLHHRLI